MYYNPILKTLLSMRAKTILWGALALGLCACTNDDNLTEGNDKLAAATDGVYMKFNIALPTSDGTRSATSTDEDDDYVVSTGGVEVGTDDENNINSLLVVLTDDDDTYIASVEAIIGSADLTKVGDQTYVLRFDGEELTKYEDKTVNVYVYCNPVSSLPTDKFDADGTYTITNAEADVVWQSGSMLMSSAEAHIAELSDLSSHTVVDQPLDLGTIYVERSVARFDYKDGSDGENNTYTVGELYVDNDNNTPVTVTLTDMAVVNMSKSFYYLHRTAADAATPSENGTAVANYSETKLLGVEASNNWIIDTDAATKFGWTSLTDLSANFSYNLGSDLEWTSLSSLNNADDPSNWTGETEENVDKTGYYVWRYVTENTIPSVDDQKHGISTGVVFKGTINVTVDEGTTLYAFGSTLYAGWSAVAAAVEAANDQTNPLTVAYDKVLEQMEIDENEGTPTADELAAADAGISAYTVDENGNYNVYYYYWNRHNNNGIDEIMGRMEFAVVRNNVYKLSVTAINQFGYPEGDTPDPDDPDESTEYYFQVDVVILPWVVRLNNITF
ncbi:MAG: Mfa1 family fimbria major subunit [Prevotellaceae bacterium]|nr:Mfa1 family fimbria major subunit [Prevotellaceae bacterium]